MKITTHLTIGVIGYFIFDIWFIVGSIIIDTPLLFNELKLRMQHKKFNPEKVSNTETVLYRITHSLLFLLLFIIFNNHSFFIAILLHQIMDWFSHTGRFETRIFYPISKKTIKGYLNVK